MANTFKLISSTTVPSGGTSTITFSSIPNTYTDLMLYASPRNEGNNAGILIRCNGDSATNYAWRRMGANWNTDTNIADTYTAQTYIFGFQTPALSTANYYGGTRIYIPNYTQNINKVMSIDSTTESNNTNYNYQILESCAYNSTAVIDSITIVSEDAGADIAENSVFSLYGISNT